MHGVQAHHDYPPDKIRAALARLGEIDVLDWALRYPTQSLVQLNARLAAGVAPVDLERFMADAARDSGRYDALVRLEAVRRLNEYFPGGFGSCERPENALASAWAMWAGLCEPSQKQLARDVWHTIERTLAEHPQWCPAHADDELLSAAFEGKSLAPTDGGRRFANVLRTIEQELYRDDCHGSTLRVVENLRNLPPGYGLVFGLMSVDGEVCNGGFMQFYENTGGAPARLAIEGFRLIGRHHFAAIVGESLAYAKTIPDLGVALPGSDDPLEVNSAPRPFESLDQAYYDLRGVEGADWFETALIDMILLHPVLFRSDTPGSAGG